MATAPAATPDVAPGSVAGPADAPASPVADTAPPGTPAAPREVALTELTFARYVEPKDRRRTLSSRPGWVQLSFTVAADGTPRDIRIVESSPSGRYDSAALSAVKRWRFVPVIEDGQPVERRTAVRLRFQPE